MQHSGSTPAVQQNSSRGAQQWSPQITPSPHGSTHVPSTQASQQLETWPTHAVPPFGATHRLASRFVEHFVLSFLVLQHVTKPGFPHVDLAAHFFTTPLQLLFVIVALMCWTAHETYAP